MKRPAPQTIYLGACSVIAAAALVVMLVFVMAANHAASEARGAVDQVIAQRTESRIQICLKDQKFANAHNNLVLALATDTGEHPVPPELQAAVDANTVKVPNCTPAGIAAFYAGTARP